MRKFFRAGCAANLVANWIPALQDIKDKLESGGRAADVGCRQGASMLLMAKAYPQSQYFGFGYHDKFIAAALESAKQEGVSDSVSFEVSKSKRIPSRDYHSWRCSIAFTTWAIRLEQSPSPMTS